MKAPEDFFHYLEQSLNTLAHDESHDEDRIGSVYALVSQFFVAAGEDEPLHFTTLFARIAHLCNRFRINATLTRRMQRFRIDAETYLRKGVIESSASAGDIWINGAYALHDIASLVLEISKSSSTYQLIGKKAPDVPVREKRRGTFKRHANLVAYDIDTAKDALLVYDAEGPEGEIILKYGDAGRSELFKDNVLQAVSLIGFPLTLSALDIEIDADASYSPRILVIEPDYLIDISTIAECYQESGGDVRLYVPKKYQEARTTPALLIGKIANYFLDELVHDTTRSFNELFPKSFFLNPVEFATLTNDEVKHMTKECEIHFTNLRTVILNEFEKLDLVRTKMYIEPAFFCPAYGLQGRLDLFLNGHENKHIVELKSGQPFQANAYGLSSSHYAQTLLYDLMIKAVYEFQARQTCYILYSRSAMNTLRFAPPVEAIQREVIRLRNEILLTECTLSQQDISSEGLFEKIRADAFPETKGFLQKEIMLFDETWRNLDDLEKRYIRIFSRFIAREHFLAKVGTHGSDQVNGLAGLWLDTDGEKEERFAIYRDLVVKEIEQPDRSDAYIIFSKETVTGALANFRVGDIAVLYPTLDREPSVLRTQIYKCTVTELTEGQIKIRLRSGQVNYDDIRAHPRWVLEHDLYDKSFNTMHSALFTLAKTSVEKRAMFLGRTPPGNPEYSGQVSVAKIGEHQKAILDQIIAAKDYFLLWGPPGTGKTSVILHHLVKHHLDHTQDRLILLAYTNRAVDEICEALDAIGGEVRQQYVRIGSHIGTGSAYQEQLLGNKIKGMTRRRQIVDFLISQRVIVGTIASISGKMELFKIVRADVAIVDEASQILEPMLAGLLPAFRKWVLIGDHRQLPAVVAQPVSQSRLGEDAIPEIALEDTRDSYFERMYHLCQSRKWDWAYGSLTEQGRMHEEIMAFPSRVFYNNQLHLLLTKRHDGRDYSGSLKTPHAPDASPLSQVLASKRMLWFPSVADTLLQFSKTHNDEAQIVVNIVQELIHLYGRIPDIGIITPFRAQIANIRAHLQQHGIDPNIMTIDTVERYQGSARNIILLSLSIHHPVLLQRIVSMSSDGVDRKLNVALTRAREQFILVASESVVKFNKTYSDLCDTCFTVRTTAVDAYASSPEGR
ncbi:MAG TPA: AAA domain-containing protein [Saprospiraceae bacterium]|nr:AAA domain-containing protein [Saprospiraceae bacterium]